MNRKVRSFGNFLLFTTGMLIMITWAIYLFHLKFSGHDLHGKNLLLEVELSEFNQSEPQIDSLKIPSDQEHFSMLDLKNEQ